LRVTVVTSANESVTIYLGREISFIYVNTKLERLSSCIVQKMCSNKFESSHLDESRTKSRFLKQRAVVA